MSESPEPTIVTTISGQVATVTLAVPQAFNALSRRLTEELDQQLNLLSKDDLISVLLLRSEGKHFCAGADIGDMSAMSYEEAVTSDFIGCSRALGAFPKPVVVAVQGMALGGGCELVEMCDIVVASDDATFAHPEVTLNAMPGAGGTQRLPRVVGRHLAMDMLLTARKLSAAEALSAGLVSRVVPREQLDAEAQKISAELTKRPLALLRRIKQSTLNSLPKLDEGLLAEAEYFRQCFNEPEFVDALQAFAKRQSAK